MAALGLGMELPPSAPRVDADCCGNIRPFVR
jgi:hypothetical protein